MLLDPFEEQFDLPAALVELRDGQGGKRPVVGQEGEPLPGFGVAIRDASQGNGILLRRLAPCNVIF